MNLLTLVLSVLRLSAMVSASSIDVDDVYPSICDGLGEGGPLPLLVDEEYLDLQSKGASNLEESLMREDSSGNIGSQMQNIWARQDSEQGQVYLLASESKPRARSRANGLETLAQTDRFAEKLMVAIGESTFLLRVSIWPAARAVSLSFLLLFLITWCSDTSCDDTPSSCYEDQSGSVVDGCPQDLFDFAHYESLDWQEESLDKIICNSYGIVKSIDSVSEQGQI